MLMIINALLIAACAHAAEFATASTFRPWALNDSKAFVFPRIAEKRNRGRRERLAAALQKDGDAIAAALRFVDWNSLGVAWPRRRTAAALPAAFAALVAICVQINFGRHAIDAMRHRWRTAAPTA